MSDSSEASYLRTQGPKPKKTKYGRYVQDISKEEIESVFCHPAEEACVKLGICLTILKRLCRKFGIPRWPYRRLKCTIKPKDDAKKSKPPQVRQPTKQQELHHRYQQQQQQQRLQQALPASPEVTSKALNIPSNRRNDRPQRQAALGVQDAVGRAKADINDDEQATVAIAPRNGKKSNAGGMASLADDNTMEPAVPEPSQEELAYQSMSAEESQALSVLLGGIGRDPAAAAAAAAALGGGSGTPVRGGSDGKGFYHPNAPVVAPLHQEKPAGQQQQQPQDQLAPWLSGMNNNGFMFDPNMLKSMELAIQMHFVAEQQRQQQQQQAAAAAMAAFAAAAAGPAPGSTANLLANTQNAQMFAAIMQTMSAMSPQDPATAMLARSMLESFSATSMPQMFPSTLSSQAPPGAAWNVGAAQINGAADVDRATVVPNLGANATSAFHH